MNVSEDVSGCLRAQDHGHQPTVCSFHQNASGEVHTSDVGYTVGTSCNASGRNLCYDARGNGDGETVCTITGDHQNRVTDYMAIVATMQGFGNYRESEIASSCKMRDYKDATDLVVMGIDAYNHVIIGDIAATLNATSCETATRSGPAVMSVDCRNGYENNELSGTVQAKENGGQSLNYINPVRCDNTVRRLTPLECERLQGYPDGWTDIDEWVDSKGKTHKEADSPRYKALGNSIALPFWKYLLKRISA